YSVLGMLLISGVATVAATPSHALQQAQAQGSAQASAEVNKGQASGSTSGSSTTSAQTDAQAGQVNSGLASGTAMNIALNAPVDSKKAKTGDAVAAHTTEAVKADGKTVIPKGTKLIGHVTQASTRAKGESESTLGVVFDKAVLKNGQEVPINASIQAL